MSTNRTLARLIAMRRGEGLGAVHQPYRGSTSQSYGGSAASRAQLAQARTAGAAAITASATEGLARIIAAARGVPPQHASAQPSQGSDLMFQGQPMGPQGDALISGSAGPSGVNVSTPWGSIALGGAAIVVLGGFVIWIATRKPAPAPQLQRAA
jgi:hypothetical protein